MTKAELIKALERFPDDMQVVVWDNERSEDYDPEIISSVQKWAHYENPEWKEMFKKHKYMIDERFPERIIL